MQAEHSQALRQEQDRLSAIKADYEAQLSCTQQQLADVRKAADQARMAESHARQAQEESNATIHHMQVPKKVVTMLTTQPDMYVCMYVRMYLTPLVLVKLRRQ